MNHDVMKSVLLSEALRLVASAMLFLALATTYRWWKSFQQRRMLKSAQKALDDAERQCNVDALRPTDVPSPYLFGCYHCPDCHCWVRGTQGPCMQGPYCDCCKTKNHATKEGTDR